MAEIAETYSAREPHERNINTFENCANPCSSFPESTRHSHRLLLRKHLVSPLLHQGFADQTVLSCLSCPYRHWFSYLRGAEFRWIDGVRRRAPLTFAARRLGINTHSQAQLDLSDACAFTIQYLLFYP